MDTAYDHILEESLVPEDDSNKPKAEKQPQQSLNAEFEEAYKAISSSPWGARLGALVGTVKKQGESYLEASKTEYAHVSEQATKGFAGLASNIVSRTRSLSLVNPLANPTTAPAEASSSTSTDAPAEGTTDRSAQSAVTEGIFSRIKAGIKEVERLEARADQYLDSYATNLANFLKEAVTISPPEGHDFAGEESAVPPTPLTPGEPTPAARKIYTTRLDAQLHLLHTSLDLFKTDPTVSEYEAYSKTFSAEEKTENVAKDLESYPELRNTMEQLVPDVVSYAEFWKRYYFLRSQLDAEEQKRKDLLKGVQDEEEVGWGEDDEDEDDDDEEDEEEEEEESEDEKVVVKKKTSKDTLVPGAGEKKEEVKKEETKRVSEERAESEQSYDMVSGAPSRAGGSPNVVPKKPVEDDSDEDWE